MEIIVFPDVEGLLIDYLSEELDERGYTGTEVATRVAGVGVGEDPNERPDRFVRVMRLGGAVRDRAFEESRVAIEFWDQTETGAHTGIQLCLGLVFALDAYRGTQFYMDNRTRPAPVNLPDPASAHVRYTGDVELTVRGHAV